MSWSSGPREEPSRVDVDRRSDDPIEIDRDRELVAGIIRRAVDHSRHAPRVLKQYRSTGR